MPLSVNAGVDQSIYLGQNAALTATPSGATGTPTYVWSVISGSGTFSAGTSASTNFTPSTVGPHNLRVTVTDTSGSATDDIQVICSAVTHTASVQTVTVETSWTKTPTSGLTTKQILSDSSGATYVTSDQNPSNRRLEFTLQPLLAPGSGVPLVVTVSCDALEASSAYLNAYLYQGATLRSTVTAVPVPTGTTGASVAGTAMVTFPAADVAAVTDWSGLTVRLEVTATV